ncbi:30S ribosomal protein S3 [Dolichospermum sp. ST_sed1]|nr:30S ribosomal protein S3 [Dolichospermum sp. ST_sed1]MDD1424631.1 30S ribosomal protein S3 [Dolichospermum sp. ST_sed9]MDD1431459.1 30S ribosomal protein S3 [Dolichospermum sp. ST_sed6]MDD1440952.1 30S ribosomal protein S3 [Dolichospermum sp. ST_sed3]MDD1446403.1 30S ribosomal protein S3 [Dolichospermum sp. ST_sed8]MDD1456164.1 30S ribosomal protein S3 [Dolichospermum sp. ST_sed7]MDD1460868.1 30S ribosomal protein S3 [Dolichospermum sp. ST_sed2]MDD1464801.1 30S ribosomal protein S3 [Dolic
MGQKIHPVGFRLGITQEHQSRWFAEPDRYPELLQEDYKLRQYIEQKLGRYAQNNAGISEVRIERKADQIDLEVRTARPGVVVGRGGQGIESLRLGLQGALGGNRQIRINVVEIQRVDADAYLIAEYIAQQLERRVSFRRVVRQSIQRAQRAGVQGIKVQVGGRLNGAEIARSEWTREGRVPLHTLRADIDYSSCSAKTTYGILGIKVWVFKGEIIPGQEQAPEQPARDRDRDRDRERGDRDREPRRKQQRRRQQFEDRSNES